MTDTKKNTTINIKMNKKSRKCSIYAVICVLFIIIFRFFVIEQWFEQKIIKKKLCMWARSAVISITYILPVIIVYFGYTFHAALAANRLINNKVSNFFLLSLSFLLSIRFAAYDCVYLVCIGTRDKRKVNVFCFIQLHSSAFCVVVVVGVAANRTHHTHTQLASVERNQFARESCLWVYAERDRLFANMWQK